MVSVGYPELVLCADVYSSPGALAFRGGRGAVAAPGGGSGRIHADRRSEELAGQRTWSLPGGWLRRWVGGLLSLAWTPV